MNFGIFEFIWHSVEISGIFITQILREINFWDSRNAKTAIFAILRAVDFVNLVNFILQEVQKFTKIIIQTL